MYKCNLLASELQHERYLHMSSNLQTEKQLPTCIQFIQRTNCCNICSLISSDILLEMLRSHPAMKSSQFGSLVSVQRIWTILPLLEFGSF